MIFVNHNFLTLELGYNSYKTKRPMLQQKCKEKKKNYIIYLQNIIRTNTL